MNQIKNKKNVYIIGIEGGGTSALAQIYKSFGYEVSGSDNGDHFFGNALMNVGIKVFSDFSVSNLPSKIDFVVYSTAYKEDNIEIKEAKKRGLELLSYPEALAKLFNKKEGIAVAGTHGKTSITAMIGELLETAKLDPTVLVGGEVVNWKKNTIIGQSKYFVLEADEYQNKLQYYNPKIVILNNIDFDHPDFFPTLKEYKLAFSSFLEKLSKDVIVIANFDDENIREVVSGIKAKVISFGKTEADFTVQFADDKMIDCSKFYVFKGKENLGEFKLKVFGNHNIMNSLSVIALGQLLDINIDVIKKSLQNFSGTKRRLEYKGKYQEAVIYDDFAHHPTEIKASLSAVRKRYPRNKIYCLFHPHSFSRTKSLLQEFAKSFQDVDEVFILDIYGSARESSGDIHSKDLVNEINIFSQKEKAIYLPTIEKCVDTFKKGVEMDSVIITMGAGDVWRVGEELLNIT